MIKTDPTGIRPEQRFSEASPCPICGGYENARRGVGERCYGFSSRDDEWAHCTREEYAGGLERHPKAGTFVHRLTGDCKCGVRHDLAAGRTYERNGHTRRERSRKGRIVKVYSYRDEHDDLISQTVRLEPKDFRQRRPDSYGGWIWNLQGVHLVLYRLRELLAADREKLALVCAGEKDADTAADRLGFLATTNPLGEGKWKSEYSEPLRGRPVAIIPHNDEAGSKHAEDVARSLHGKAASVKVVYLPGVPERGGDLTDWTDAGGTSEELERLIGEAPEWTPPEEREDDRVLLGRVLREGIEPPEVLIDDVLLAGRTHAIYGPSGHGKTYVEIWLALEVIKRGKPVLFFDNENNVSIVAERLEQLGADPYQIDELLHYYPFPELATTNEGRQVFEAKLDRIKPALVCFDSWISFLASNGLDENSSNDIAEFSVHYLQPARRRGIATLILDHVPHEGNHARGSTRKRDEVDVMWSLSRLQSFDRDQVGSLVLNRVKDREGWLPQSVSFSIGGTEGGGFVFSRSSGTIETEGEDGLKGSERKALEALETFDGRGAKAVEWEKKAKGFDVARRTFYRAKIELERKRLIYQEKGLFFMAGATDAKEVPWHQMAPAPGRHLRKQPQTIRLVGAANPEVMTGTPRRWRSSGMCRNWRPWRSSSSRRMPRRKRTAWRASRGRWPHNSEANGKIGKVRRSRHWVYSRTSTREAASHE